MTHWPAWRTEAEDVLLAATDRSEAARARVVDLLAVTLAGTDGPLRAPTGRRVTPLTPTGAPVEVKISSGGEGGAYTAVPGLAARYFGPRLRAESAATVAVASQLAEADREAIVADAERLVAACVPDVADVAPRTNHATYLGVAHRRDGTLRGLRVYASLRLHPAAVAMLARTQSSFGRLAAAIEGLEVEPAMAAVHVDEPEGRVHKLYVRLPETGSTGVLGELAARIGASVTEVGRAVEDLGVAPEALGRGALVAVRTRVDGSQIDLAVHLTRRVLGDGPARWRAATHLAEGAHGSATMARSLAVVRDRPGAWQVSVLALATGRAGTVARSSVYMAPTVAAQSV